MLVKSLSRGQTGSRSRHNWCRTVTPVRGYWVIHWLNISPPSRCRFLDPVMSTSSTMVQHGAPWELSTHSCVLQGLHSSNVCVCAMHTFGSLPHDVIQDQSASHCCIGRTCLYQLWPRRWGQRPLSFRICQPVPTVKNTLQVSLTRD
jgi:hypothetical protein